jgi:hypothetical protein
MKSRLIVTCKDWSLCGDPAAYAAAITAALIFWFFCIKAKEHKNTLRKMLKQVQQDKYKSVYVIYTLLN